MLHELLALGGQRRLSRDRDGVLLGGRSSGGSQQALPAQCILLPLEIQPPLDDNFPQENIEDLNMQIPEEPSHSDQPVTSHVGVSEASQKPNTEKDEHPGKAC